MSSSLPSRSGSTPASLSPHVARHGVAWLALALLLAAFALRVFRLPAQSLWYDEGVSWYLSRMSLPDLLRWTGNDIQPPLYYGVLWAWVRLAGCSEFALRFPSVVFALLGVPLFHLIGRRLVNRLAGFLGLFLAVFSPLYVYYSQEARMYTLLVWLGLLASWLLLRLLDRMGAHGRRFPWGPAAGYVMTAGAALYTHYFAVFLLLAHACYALFVWAARGRPKWGSLLSVPLAVGMLFAPWLPTLVTRYGVDSSYWPGALKLGEAARKVLLAFAVGETVKERTGTLFGLGHAAVWLLSTAAMALTAIHSLGMRNINLGSLQRRRHLSNLVFLLLWLVVPLGCIVLLSCRTPKFNPRYAMLAWPAFVLIVACGLSSLVTHPSRRLRFFPQPPPPGDHVPGLSWLLFVLALLFVLVTDVFSLSNWFQPYRQNQFNKPDFRITAGIVKERIQPGETVILSSGHMFPAWAYYYGWDEWLRVPDIEVLDVNAALDMRVGDELQGLLQGKTGVWLVRWQNEVTDPFDVLPLYLGTVGRQDDYGQFWHMELFHYQLPGDAEFAFARFLTDPVDADFDRMVRLMGLRRRQDEILLFWRASQPVNRDYTVFVHLLDAEGRTVAGADHLPAISTHLWPAGHILPDRATLALPAGADSEHLRLEIGLYLADDPAMPRLGPVTCTHCIDTGGDRALIPVPQDAAP